MQYKEVETFLEVVRTRNITRTAEILYVSQSTVSNRIKSLEAEVGCQLIVRTRGHRTVQLTRQGEEFVQIAARWKELFDETERLKSSSLNALRIATSESTYYTWLAPFLQKFFLRHPGGRVRVHLCDSELVYTLIERNQIDFGFASFESARNGIFTRCIDRQPLCVIRYSEQPGPEQVLHPSTLDPSKEIRFIGGFFAGINAWHERWFGLDRGWPLEINTSHGIIPLMEHSDYWAISPITVARDLARETSLQIYRLEEQPEDWQIFMLRRQESSPGSIQLCRLFEAEFLEYIDEIHSEGAAESGAAKGEADLETV